MPINTLMVHRNPLRFDARSYQLGGALVRNDINVRFAGEGAEADLRGFYLALDQELLDHHLILDHAVPNCYSNQLYKGIADGRGTTVFNGKIFVRKDAQKTNAYQSNKNLLLSPKATVNTKPQLEIFADDVRCSHGATSGQLNEEALFYLQARGIPPAEARKMLLRAFAAEALEGRPEDVFREHLMERLDERLS
jgi:Fe-S cluster assembly protein SufD